MVDPVFIPIKDSAAYIIKVVKALKFYKMIHVY